MQQQHPTPPAFFVGLQMAVLVLVVCAEFFLLQVMALSILNAVHITDELIQKSICGILVIFIMCKQYYPREPRYNTLREEIVAITSSLVPLGVGCCGFLVLLLLRLLLWVTAIDTTPLSVNIITPTGTVDWPMIADSLFFSIVIEELSLRRSLHNTIKWYFPSRQKALLFVSASMFALLHCLNFTSPMFSKSYVFVEVVYAFVAGFSLSYFTEESGIIPAFLLHFCNNLVSITNPFALTLPVLLYLSLSLLIFVGSAFLLNASKKQKLD